jgi:LAO/AO transport system kinase
MPNTKAEPPSAAPRHRRLSTDELVEGVLAADRAVLGQAITLIESNAPAHQAQAQEVLSRLLPHTGNARRVGITGVPGVGKSTFIEGLGTLLTSRGHRVAVLAIDPTSGITGGSILGDKTRMNKLARDESAFVRPSPSSGSLGGVGRKTRETMLVCEAAGYDVILVETVGVGQSETLVADMVDSFLVLMLAGAGDELQGIKRGILELADVIAINKADGDNAQAAQRARHENASALKLMRPTSANWRPRALTCSGLQGDGLDALWSTIEEHRDALGKSGELAERRREQMRRWMWSMVEARVLSAIHQNPQFVQLAATLERQVLDAQTTPTLAAAELLRVLGIQPEEATKP